MFAKFSRTLRYCDSVLLNEYSQYISRMVFVIYTLLIMGQFLENIKF